MTDLFKQWLSETRQLQIDSYGTDPAALEGKERIDYTTINILAATDELHEMLAETSWKPWAKAEFFNRDQFVNEAVDALHFVANMLVAAGCTDEELNQRYLSKMDKNRKRMANDYTGLDKCDKCRRAMDDVGPCYKHKDDPCGLCSICGRED